MATAIANEMDELQFIYSGHQFFFAPNIKGKPPSVKFILVHFESSRSERSWMLGNSEEKSTERPVLCLFQVFHFGISTKCTLLCLSYSREEGSLGLSGRRAIFGERGGS